MHIGIIDSGFGGYAFLKGINNKSSTYSLIMDRAFFPYGNKSYEFLKNRTIFLISYLIKYYKVDMVILACNTLSSMLLEDLKVLFNIKIEGVLNLFKLKEYKNTLFLATTNTIKYIKDKYNNLDYLDGSLLIEYIEHKKYNEIKDYINKNRNLFDSYTNIVLGCTHFIMIKHLFNNYISQDELFNIKMSNRICDS